MEDVGKDMGPVDEVDVAGNVDVACIDPLGKPYDPSYVGLSVAVPAPYPCIGNYNSVAVLSAAMS